jgi:hypothetical protein
MENPPVISLNLRRRHLDESQRAVVAAKLENLKQRRPEERCKFASFSGEQAAPVSRPESVASVSAAADVAEGRPSETASRASPGSPRDRESPRSRVASKSRRHRQHTIK